MPVHAEVEGGIFKNQFRELLKKALNMGIEVVPLKVIKEKLDIKTLPIRKYRACLEKLDRCISEGIAL